MIYLIYSSKSRALKHRTASIYFTKNAWFSLLDQTQIKDLIDPKINNRVNSSQKYKQLFQLNLHAVNESITASSACNYIVCSHRS